MSQWYIENAGQKKSLKQWKASGLGFTFRSQMADEAGFVVDGKTNFDEEQIFAYDSEVKFYKGDVLWFTGRVAQTPRTCRSNADRNGYLISGPWQDLEEIIYRQTWAQTGGGVRTGSVFLCGSLTTGQVITNVLTWAIQCGASLQVGTIEPAIYLPYHQVQDQTCAEIIRNMLHMSPDAVTYFDYSTSPPTFNCKLRASLPKKTVSLPGEFFEGQILERYDLQIPCVYIAFRRLSTIDGKRKYSWTFQKYPPEANAEQRGTLAHTFDLEGQQVQTLSTEIVTEPINPTLPAFWAKSYPYLVDPSYTKGVTISSVKITDKDDVEYSLADYPNELVDGTIPKWMVNELGVLSKRLKVTAKATWTNVDADGTELGKDDKPLTVHLPLTDAESGVYVTTASRLPGEAEPKGLAEALYRAHEKLQYQGTINTHERECSGSVRVGNALNIDSASGRYSAMDALVVEVNEQVDTGTTSITIGPQRSLGADELIEYFRSLRWRRLWENPSIQETGEPDEESAIDISASSAGRESGNEGGDRPKRVVVKESSNMSTVTPSTVSVTQNGNPFVGTVISTTNVAVRGGGGAINLDATKSKGKTLEPIELTVCQGGVEKKLMVIGSGPY